MKTEIHPKGRAVEADWTHTNLLFLTWPLPRASFEQGGGGRGGGGFGPKTWCTKNGLTRFSLL